MVLSGQISIGKFVAFNSYIGMLVWPMIACGDCLNTFSQAAAAFQRIAMIFREKPDITDSNVTAEADTEAPLKGDIQFNHLTFTYPDGELPVLCFPPYSRRGDAWRAGAHREWKILSG